MAWRRAQLEVGAQNYGAVVVQERKTTVATERLERSGGMEDKIEWTD